MKRRRSEEKDQKIMIKKKMEEKKCVRAYKYRFIKFVM